MRRVAGIVAVLVLVQGALWGMWRLRTPRPAPFDVVPASGPAPALAPRDGFLHVWATWCAPCRDELPDLLAAAREEGVSLVAVSVDTNPDALPAFFDGAVPPEVVRDPTVAAAAGVRELPATLRVEKGRLVERVQGAREWTSTEARAWLSR